MAQRCTNHLMDEHREAEVVLNDLERFVNDVASGAAWNAAQRAEFERIFAFITRLMSSHIHKEHHILFPALENFLPPDEGPLDVLRNEHVSIEAVARRLKIIAERAASAAGPSASRDFVRAGKEFLRSCRDHIYKEDKILFPMVARFLPDERDAELLAEMQNLEMAKEKGASGVQ